MDRCGEVRPILDGIFGELHMNDIMVHGLSRRRALRFWAVIGLSIVTILPARANGDERRNSPIVRAVAQARGAVVSIQGRKRVQSPMSLIGTQPERQVKGMGTGVILDSRGFILTNFHVVDGVERIEVTLADGQKLIGQMVARDKPTDLAIIRIQTNISLPTIPIGTSSDLMPGEAVIAVGNAYGYDHTVTSGIISALHRPVQVSETQEYTDLIQTDASINPGNSGGPLLNINGKMIGLNVAVRVGAQGIGFAIPVNEAVRVAARMLYAEQSANIIHGVMTKTVETGSVTEAVVVATSSDSPGEKAGIQEGDVILRIDGRRITGSLDFEFAFVDRQSGEEVEFEIERAGGDPISVTVVLKSPLSKPVPPTTNDVWTTVGVELELVSERVVRQMHGTYGGGLRVTKVRADSPAAQEGVVRGDILVGMHKWETANLENLEFVLRSSEVQQGTRVKFYILRDGRTWYGWFDLTSDTQ